MSASWPRPPRHLAQLVRDDEQLSCATGRRSEPRRRRPTTKRCWSTSEGPGCIPGNPGERTHALRPVSRRAREGGTTSSRNLLRTPRSGAQDLHRQRRLHELPFRTPISPRPILRDRPFPVRSARATRSRTPGRNPAADGKPVQPARPLQRRPDGDGAPRARARHLSRKASFGEFKVPSLRNLILTAPYGRDGGVETLAEVVRHYAWSRSGQPARQGRETREAPEPHPARADRPRRLPRILEHFSNGWRPDDGGQCH